jgi:hypothetical protein
MTIVIGARPSRPPRRSRRTKVLAPIGLLIAVGVFGLRLLSEPHAGTAVTSSAPARFVPLPPSGAIASAWGIRFTGFFLEADRGLIDLRYQVVNPAVSARIHGGSATNPDPNAALKALPVFIDEANGKVILPDSAMLHFEHFHFQTELLGNTYSVIYGNTHGLLHVGDKVTIKMEDGTELKHVTVSN